MEPLVPAVKSGGRPARHTRRESVNAILYVVQGGNPWRALPHDLPPWQTAYTYFRLWRNDETWETIHSAVREQARKRLGRETPPSAAILNRQSVKSSQRGAARLRRQQEGNGT